MEWADGMLYPTRISLACLLADQMECDKLCCNNTSCHHCWVDKMDWLNVEKEFTLKSVDEVKSKVFQKAEGKFNLLRIEYDVMHSTPVFGSA